MERISAVVVAQNQERNLPRCLDSLTWTDEIVVVDAHSTDQTADIARAYGARVLSRDWPGYVEQKRFALSEATGEWVISLDADEELDPALIDELRWNLAHCGPEIQGFWMPRKCRYLGRWITHGDWYPDRKLRVFRRDRASCHGVDPHDYFEVSGETKILQGHILHYSFEGIADHVDRIARYAALAAEHCERQGIAFSWWRMAVEPLRRGFRCYVLRRGFLDGVQGVLICVLIMWSVFLTHALLYERQRKRGPRESRA